MTNLFLYFLRSSVVEKHCIYGNSGNDILCETTALRYASLLSLKQDDTNVDINDYFTRVKQCFSGLICLSNYIKNICNVNHYIKTTNTVIFLFCLLFYSLSTFLCVFLFLYIICLGNIQFPSSIIKPIFSVQHKSESCTW